MPAVIGLQMLFQTEPVQSRSIVRSAKNHVPALAAIGPIGNFPAILAHVKAVTTLAAASALYRQMYFINQHGNPLKEKRPKSLGSLFGLFELGWN